ncbi:sulfotransferase [Roseivivax sp. GX 12232]|uniref:sulfotransferase family protein n=1 Tax=Roseivivax sp. GX 12232 TaxID=2900547 RepID=UPI001E3F6AD1|nr:sulfotransferase [Roseivivax sp. GX 12232]MCE0505815.1 sulfotransferase [Roseivivax sp. GX 12232]
MPEPIFLIAPGRSYTSLIGGMIGQHPQVYGMPEISVSHADTIGGVLQTLKGPLEYGLAGLLRLLAQLHDGEQTEETVNAARQWLMQRAHWSIAELFAHIQDQVGDKALFDKSPRTVTNYDNMARLLQVFPNASFLHLTRHPITTCKSAMALRNSFADANKPKRRARINLDPENTWRRAQDNITRFTATLPPGQCLRVKAEMILSDPPKYLAQICEWLGLSTEPDALEAMMHPENSPYASIGPPSALYGNDPNFLKNPVLDMSRLQNIAEPSLDSHLPWRDDGGALAPETIRLARQFGYG